MAWYDGTENYTKEKLFKAYPKKICRGLFLSDDGKRLAIVNDFEENTPFYKASDPKREEDFSEKNVFYHVFAGEDGVKARAATEEFIKTADLKDSDSVLLLRKDPDRLFAYGNGHICLSLLEITAALADGVSDGSVFILPLMLYFHRCPVCGKRTLSERGMFEICAECGWEDEGIDGEDEEPVFAPNGDCTIREYRKKYFEFKAEDPLYSRWGDCLKRKKENKEKR